MDYKRQIMLEKQANNKVKAVNPEFDVVYSGGMFTLCFNGRVVGNYDTIADCIEGASYYER